MKKQLSLRAFAKQSHPFGLLRHFVPRNDRLVYALSKNRIVIGLAIISLFLTLGCQPENSPVPINSEEDMCEYCRMTIGGFHYAAEIIEKRKAHKFDDIGCMLAYAQANKLSPENARFWVMDFDNSTWIKGEEAYFIISPEIRTPMGHGIVAFKDANKAKEVADKNKVEVVELETIFDLYWKPRHEH